MVGHGRTDHGRKEYPAFHCLRLRQARIVRSMKFRRTPSIMKPSASPFRAVSASFAAIVFTAGGNHAAAPIETTPEPISI
jgi:hypothetical protein